MKRKHQQPQTIVGSEALKQINENAAGIDIHLDEHWVSVPEDKDEYPVRKFGTFTQDLHAIADWLERCGVTTVAMESTSVYWIPLYEVLESRSFEVCLVNAQATKNVTGRKSGSAGLPVASAIAHLRFTPSIFSTASGYRDSASLCTSSGQSNPLPFGPHSAYAEGASVDESQVDQCCLRHHRRHRHADHTRDCGG